MPRDVAVALIDCGENPRAGVTVELSAKTTSVSGSNLVTTYAISGDTDENGEVTLEGVVTGIRLDVRFDGVFVKSVVVPTGTEPVALATLFGTSGQVTDTIQQSIESAIATHAGNGKHLPDGGAVGQVPVVTGVSPRVLGWTTPGSGGGIAYKRTPVAPVDDEAWVIYNQNGATFDFNENGLDVECPPRNVGAYESSIIARPFNYSTQSAIIGLLIDPVAGNNSYPARQGIAMLDGTFFMSLLNTAAGVWGTAYNSGYAGWNTGLVNNAGGGPALTGAEFWWLLEPSSGSLCSASYSIDGVNFTRWGTLFDYGFNKLGFQSATVGSGAENQRGKFRVFDFEIF